MLICAVLALYGTRLPVPLTLVGVNPRISVRNHVHPMLRGLSGSTKVAVSVPEVPRTKPDVVIRPCVPCSLARERRDVAVCAP